MFNMIKLGELLKLMSDNENILVEFADGREMCYQGEMKYGKEYLKKYNEHFVSNVCAMIISSENCFDSFVEILNIMHERKTMYDFANPQIIIFIKENKDEQKD